MTRVAPLPTPSHVSCVYVLRSSPCGATVHPWGSRLYHGPLHHTPCGVLTRCVFAVFFVVHAFVSLHRQPGFFYLAWFCSSGGQIPLMCVPGHRAARACTVFWPSGYAGSFSVGLLKADQPVPRVWRRRPLVRQVDLLQVAVHEKACSVRVGGGDSLGT